MPQTNYTSSIKHWADEDRPREKLMLQGAQHLTNAELLAIIIGSGLPGISAVQLMQQLLLRCNHRLQELQKLPLEEIKAIKGIAAAKAVKI